MIHYQNTRLTTISAALVLLFPILQHQIDEMNEVFPTDYSTESHSTLAFSLASLELRNDALMLYFH